MRKVYSSPEAEIEKFTIIGSIETTSGGLAGGDTDETVDGLFGDDEGSEF
jgi:hypothetical protein